jgi:light-regulated signal transduction histidine kinase (bacteriophytochrome)
MGGQLTEDSRQHFNMIKGRVMRLEALINGILEYSRADRVKGTESLTNVNQLVDDVYEMLVLDQKVDLTIDNALPEFITDKLKLHQVFSNLISNAIKHCDKEVIKINLGCKEFADYYQFYVEDNGPGIEPQFYEKIFVIFQTSLARDVMESTGVGLAIVKKIIDERGGKIWVESEIGVGTKFIFEWPKKAKQSLKNGEELAPRIPEQAM